MTAEEFLKDIQIEHCPVHEYETSWNMCLEAMIKFAQYHVKEALKAASEKAEAYNIDEAGQIIYTDARIEKESILNAYPLENIK